MKTSKPYQAITNIGVTGVLLAAQAVLADVTTVPILPGVQKYAPVVSTASPTADWDSETFAYALTEVTISAAGDFDYIDYGYTAGCGVDKAIHIYTDFDPADTTANEVEYADDSETFTLSAGTYDFVSRPLDDEASDSANMFYGFSSSNGGVAEGLPATATCEGNLVTFDGTEPVAEFPNTGERQYIVVGSFVHDGGPFRPPGSGDPGYLLYDYDLIDDDLYMDTKAWYFEGDFEPGEAPVASCDDGCDDYPYAIPAGTYTYVIAPLNGELGQTGEGLRAPAIAGARTPTPVPFLPAAMILSLGALVALFGIRTLNRRR